MTNYRQGHLLDPSIWSTEPLDSGGFTCALSSNSGVLISSDTNGVTWPQPRFKVLASGSSRFDNREIDNKGEIVCYFLFYAYWLRTASRYDQTNDPPARHSYQMPQFPSPHSSDASLLLFSLLFSEAMAVTLLSFSIVCELCVNSKHSRNSKIQAQKHRRRRGFCSPCHGTARSR